MARGASMTLGSRWLWTAVLLAAVCPQSPARAVEQSGIAATYSYPGGRTASGEQLDRRKLTAAHRTLPFGTLVRVTNLRNGRTTTVRINDRGPYGRGRIIDVSPAAARALGFSGLTRVQLDIVGGPN